MAELRALRLKPQPRCLSNDNPMASTNRSSVNFKLPSNEISEARHKGGIKARDKKITNHFYQGRRNRGARRDGSPSCLFLAGAKGVKVPFSEAEKWLLFPRVLNKFASFNSKYTTEGNTSRFLERLVHRTSVS